MIKAASERKLFTATEGTQVTLKLEFKNLIQTAHTILYYKTKQLNWKKKKYIYIYTWAGVPGKRFNITVIQVYASITDTEEAEVEQFCEDLQDLLELIPNWNAKVGSQDILQITGKFGLRVQNEARQQTFWSY